MPKLIVEGQNVCGAPSRFILDGYVKQPTGIVAPDGAVLIELDAELERVVRIHVESVDAGATFAEEGDYDGADLTTAQWAIPLQLRNRFLLTSLKWGEHQLLRRPGVL